eukprot:COSAG04_NODE_2234_length_4478_cov_3.383878_2_plen_658_part_00
MAVRRLTGWGVMLAALSLPGRSVTDSAADDTPAIDDDSMHADALELANGPFMTVGLARPRQFTRGEAWRLQRARTTGDVAPSANPFAAQRDRQPGARAVRGRDSGQWALPLSPPSGERAEQIDAPLLLSLWHRGIWRKGSPIAGLSGKPPPPPFDRFSSSTAVVVHDRHFSVFKPAGAASYCNSMHGPHCPRLQQRFEADPMLEQLVIYMAGLPEMNWWASGSSSREEAFRELVRAVNDRDEQEAEPDDAGGPEAEPEPVAMGRERQQEGVLVPADELLPDGGSSEKTLTEKLEEMDKHVKKWKAELRERAAAGDDRYAEGGDGSGVPTLRQMMDEMAEQQARWLKQERQEWRAARGRGGASAQQQAAPSPPATSPPPSPPPPQAAGAAAGAEKTDGEEKEAEEQQRLRREQEGRAVLRDAEALRSAMQKREAEQEESVVFIPDTGPPAPVAQSQRAALEGGHNMLPTAALRERAGALCCLLVDHIRAERCTTCRRYYAVPWVQVYTGQTSHSTAPDTRAKGVEGHTTYRLMLDLIEKRASNLYTVFGDSLAPMVLPPHLHDEPSPAGVNLGGVWPALRNLTATSRFDSYLTVGAVSGNPGNSAIGSVGIDFRAWGRAASARTGLGLVATDSAVFWMAPCAPQLPFLPVRSRLSSRG